MSLQLFVFSVFSVAKLLFEVYGNETAPSPGCAKATAGKQARLLGA